MPVVTYQDAYDQLSALVNEIENEAVPLDELADKIRRATELIAFCQQRLRTVDADYQQALQQLQKRQ